MILTASTAAISSCRVDSAMVVPAALCYRPTSKAKVGIADADTRDIWKAALIPALLLCAVRGPETPKSELGIS